jgi:hypothetical protein
VTAVAFSGAALAVAGRDGSVRIVDWRAPTLLGGFKTYFGAVLSVAWSNDGRCVGSEGRRSVVSEWSGREAVGGVPESARELVSGIPSWTCE